MVEGLLDAWWAAQSRGERHATGLPSGTVGPAHLCREYNPGSKDPKQAEGQSGIGVPRGVSLRGAKLLSGIEGSKAHKP